MPGRITRVREIDLSEMKRTAFIPASILVLNLGACILTDKQVGDDEAADDESSDETPETDSESPDTGEEDYCSNPKPKEDADCDGVALACDNAKNQHNPDQLDQDGDDLGDVDDLCVLIPDGPDFWYPSDGDEDGIGEACDRCKFSLAQYNAPLDIEDPRLWIRNVPSNADFDQDGVGDACDNCVTVANCQAFGPDNPAPHDADANNGHMQDCQSDADLDGIGDACLDAQNQPLNGPTAAGPVGFEASDDFDQDGINNFEDGCPRLSLPRLQCESDVDCSADPALGRCADTPANDGKRYCNHSDSDLDSVGDLCDQRRPVLRHHLPRRRRAARSRRRPAAARMLER